MRSFSERHGLISPRTAIQKSSIDDRLRNRLWSVVNEVFWGQCEKYLTDSDFTALVFYRLQDNFLGEATDNLDPYTPYIIKQIKGWAFNARWNEYYDLIQFFADFSKESEVGEPYSQARLHGEVFAKRCNEVLAAEKSAYRFVGQELCEVTDETEIQAIEDATAIADSFAGARSHLVNALKLYSNREKPDYRNSIKESISAVEAAFTAVNSTKSNNLAKAIELAEGGGLVLHPAFKKGVLNIYGWTSDEAGIRHALISEGAKVGENDAKFMLVACSALVNFIVAQTAS